MVPQILIVEDDADINYVMWEALAQAGLSARQAYSGTEALLRLEQDHYDLVILDLMLPGLDGEAVLKNIRSSEKVTAVLVVSALDLIETKVGLLHAGADDYLSKPFAIEEFVARVQVQLRRLEAIRQPQASYESSEQEILSYGDFKLIPATNEAFYREEEMILTRREVLILEVLLRHPNQVFSKAQLYEAAWGEPYFESAKTVNVHISNIRKKFQDIAQCEMIDTVWGIGYRLAKLEDDKINS